MAALREVDVPILSLTRLAPVIGQARHAALVEAARRTRASFGDRIVWNVNSTASGGGVAEMLQVIVGYTRGEGLDVRWLVIEGDPEFFAITKRIHNRIHGSAGDGGPLAGREASHYTTVMARNAGPLLERVRPGDVVILHDPQTAGLASAVRSAGAWVVWRCHIGADHENEHTASAWRFLEPHVAAAHAFVFSRAAYVPRWLPADRVVVIPPSIDPLSPKNQPLPDEVVHRVLRRVGLLPPGETAPTPFLRRDGTTGEIRHAALTLSSAPPPGPDVPLVVQVSRWDRLKDMAGVLRGFADRVAPNTDAHLALVGPSVAGVTDDPEGAEVLAECSALWEALPGDVRSRVHLVTLPMDDVDENAAMVNAIQRHATVVVQKSLAEGFGLTVAEAMWKGRPVVASAIGGIVDQVVPGTGVLLDDATDLDAFGDAVTKLLGDPDALARYGAAAKAQVLENFAGDLHLLRYADLLERFD